jgi:crossover junction endodeoxyribonuclease RusA
MSFPHRAAAVATLRFVLPFPPSVSRYYRHVGYRTLLSREGRAYRKTVCALLAGRVRQPLAIPLQAELHLYPPDRRRRDWDNFQKGLWDALRHAGVYLDDSQVRRAVIELHAPDGKARAECQLAPLAAVADEERSPAEPAGSAGSPTRGRGTGGSTRFSRRSRTTSSPANSSTTGG